MSTLRLFLPIVILLAACSGGAQTLDPDFATNRTIWLSYSEPGGDGASTAFARATLRDTALTDVSRRRTHRDGRTHP